MHNILQSLLPFLFLGVITALPVDHLQRRAADPLVKNDAESGTCMNIMIIHARGTFEQGNMGSGATSFVSLVEAMATQAGKTCGVQGVNNYTAAVGEYAKGGSPSGGKFMADTAMKVLNSCPNTSVVLTGYSQGGQVAHIAMDDMNKADPTAPGKVAAIVMFGDGKGKTTPFPGIAPEKVLQICAPGDGICENPPTKAPTLSTAHLTYNTNGQQAAEFIMSKV